METKEKKTFVGFLIYENNMLINKAMGSKNDMTAPHKDNEMIKWHFL